MATAKAIVKERASGPSGHEENDKRRMDHRLRKGWIGDIDDKRPRVEPGAKSHVSNVSAQVEPPSQSVDKERTGGGTTETESEDGRRDWFKDHRLAELVIGEQLIMDQHIYEYLSLTNRLRSIEKQYNVIIVMHTDNDYAFVGVRPEEGNLDNMAELLMAQEELLHAHSTVMTTCVEEVCELNDNIPDVAREQAAAETLLKFPDILFKRSPTSVNKYIFVGLAEEAKKCRHFFMKCVTKFAKESYRDPESRMAYDIGQDLELSRYLQCEEAQTIPKQAMLAFALKQEPFENIQKALFTDGSSQLNIEAGMDVYNDSEKVENYANELNEKTSTSKPSIRFINSSSDDDDDDDNVGDGKVHSGSHKSSSVSGRQQKQQEIPGHSQDQQIRSTSSRQTATMEDSEEAGEECLNFPEEWHISLSEASFCGQCARTCTELIRLGCLHEFCLACIQNPSCTRNMCPDCGKPFSRQLFCQLYGELMERRQNLKTIASERLVTGDPGKTPADGAFTKSGASKFCKICTTPANQMIRLKCGHSLCISCFRNPSSGQRCHFCHESLNVARFSPPECEASHELNKKEHLPYFPSVGLISLKFTLRAKDLKKVRCSDEVFQTFLPDNEEGQQLFKMLMEATRKKVLFQILAAGDDGTGVIYPVKGVYFEVDPKAITTDYLTTLETTLSKLLD